MVNIVTHAGALDAHLKRHSVEYMQFSFRWVNNLLTREFPLHCVIRLWDTYLVSYVVKTDVLLLALYLGRRRFQTFLIFTCMFVRPFYSGSLKTFSRVMTFK